MKLRLSLALGILAIMAGAQANPYASYASIQATGPLASQNTVIVADDADLVLRPDGVVTVQEHLVRKILTQAGVAAGSQMGIVYSDTVKITSAHAETINPDGVLTPAADAITDISLSNQDAAMYSDGRQRNFVMPGVQVGSVLVLDYTEEIHRNDWGGNLTAAIPPPSAATLRETIRITVPPGKTLHAYDHPWPADPDLGVNTTALAASEPTADGATRYSWTWTNLYPFTPETGAVSPPSPFLAGTWNDWADVAAWYNRLADQAAQPDAAIRAKVQQLTTGAATLPQRNRDVYDFVSTKVRYVSLSFGQGDYRPHPAAEVLRNQYGDCKDKAALLIAMLRALGEEAHFTLLNSSAGVTAAVAVPSQFDHAIVALATPDGTQFLDPTTGLVPFGQLLPDEDGRPALVITPAGADLRDLPLAAAAYATRQTEAMRIGDDGNGTADLDLTPGGVIAFGVRTLLTGSANTDSPDFLKSLHVSGRDVTAFTHSDGPDSDHPLVTHAQIKLTGVADFSQSPATLTVLAGLAPITLGAPTHPRQFPLDLRALIQPWLKSESATLPDGYSPTLPPEAHIATDFARYDLSSRFDPATHQLSWTEQVQWLLPQLPPTRAADYTKFRDAVVAAEPTSIDLQRTGAASNSTFMPYTDDESDLYIEAAAQLRAHHTQKAEDEIAAFAARHPMRAEFYVFRAIAESQQQRWSMAHADLELGSVDSVRATDTAIRLAAAWAAQPSPSDRAKAIPEATHVLTLHYNDSPQRFYELQLHAGMLLELLCTPQEFAAAVKSTAPPEPYAGIALLGALSIIQQPRPALLLLEDEAEGLDFSALVPARTPAQTAAALDALVAAMQSQFGDQPWLTAARMTILMQRGQLLQAQALAPTPPAAASDPLLEDAYARLAALRARTALDDGQPALALELLHSTGTSADDAAVAVLRVRASFAAGLPPPAPQPPSTADPGFSFQNAFASPDLTASPRNDANYWRGRLLLTNGYASAAHAALLQSDLVHRGTSPMAAYLLADSEENTGADAATIVADYLQALKLGSGTLYEPLALAGLRRLHQTPAAPLPRYGFDGELDDVVCRDGKPVAVDIAQGDIEYPLQLPAVLPAAIQLPAGCGAVAPGVWVTGMARPDSAAMPNSVGIAESLSLQSAAANAGPPVLKH